MDIRSDRQKGLSFVELGRKYHIDPRTAKRYAESPQKPEYTLSEPKPTKMDPYKQIVYEWLEEAPYSALQILEKLREMGFDGGYSIVKAYVSSRKMDLNEKAAVGFETMPGKQGQMDWGFFEDHMVYEDGKWKKLYCFLMILGYSRMRCIEFVTDMSTNTLIRCHQNAFRYFGGCPEEILYEDNISCKLSDERFIKLSRDYEQEQEQLKAVVEALGREVKQREQKKTNVRKFISVVKKYTDMTQLDAAILREFVEQIRVSETYTADEQQKRVKIREIEI